MNWTRFEHRDGYCGRCLKQVTCKRRMVNHRTYFVMTLVTLGVYSRHWVRASRQAPEQWRCMRCNCEVFRLMQ